MRPFMLNCNRVDWLREEEPGLHRQEGGLKGEGCTPTSLARSHSTSWFPGSERFLSRATIPCRVGAGSRQPCSLVPAVMISPLLEWSDRIG